MRVTWLHRWLDRKPQLLTNRPRPYRPFLEQLEVRDVPATFMVTTVTDVISSTDGVLSLREAIIAANSSVARDLITFNIGTGLQTINLTSPLPKITHRVTIDGSSQTGYDPSNCNPVIELNGSGAGAGANGLWLGPGSGGTPTIPGSTIRGLAVNLFAGDGILINTNFNRIVGNHIGTNSTGVVPLGNTLNGIEIQNGASNLIGGTICCSGNVISDNQGNGILITGAAAMRNQVLGNYIGTDATGLAGLGNHQDGVKTDHSANRNTIGGTSLLARNLISGNLGDGIELGTTANFVQENWIGVDATGNAALPNLLDGVRVLVSTNTLTHNVISGNGANGVELLTGVQTTNIKGNMIGVNVQGNQPVGNTLDGIRLLTASANIIGGAGFGAGNVISGNTNGITLDGASLSNVIRGNFVGTDRTGTQKIKNTVDGINLNPLANNNFIGGSTLGTGNVISGNGDVGVFVDSDNNKIQGNRIGTDVTGTQALGNAVDGVYVEDSIGNVIGGWATDTNWGGPRNIIAANGRNGVVIRAGASLTMVQGNYIGVGLNGEHLGNADNGVFLPASSPPGSRNIIGVPFPGLSPAPAYDPRANVIGYNNLYGVDVSGGTQTYVGENDYLANVAGPTNSFASLLTGVPIIVPPTSLITVTYPPGPAGWIEFYQICNNNYYFVTRVALKATKTGGTYSFDATTYGLATGDTVTATFTTTPGGTSKFS